MGSTSGYRSGRRLADAGSGRLRHVDIIDDLRDAEPFWRSLLADGAVSTPYQSFDFLAAWHREVGSRRGVTPFVVVGFDSSDRPVFLLPFGMRRMGPLRQVCFLGGKHANFNFGLWDPTVTASMCAADMQFVLHRITALPHRPDLLALYSQPRAWQGLDNPLLKLPHRQAASNGACLVVDAPGQEVIERGVSAATRGRLRTKKRKLQKLPDYRYFQATQPAEVDRLLDRFIALKTAHMAAQGLPNVFAEEGVEAFLRSACHQNLADGCPAIELHGLEGDGELLALLGVLTDDRCMSVMVNTYTSSEHSRHSPGLILILQMIQVCADRGFASFDLGAGDAQYKTWFCKQPVTLFDSFVPLTPLGRLLAIGLDTANILKREIKNTPALWNAFQSLRRTFGNSIQVPGHHS
ncbi:MAG: GNAT family N-acetyltransferase [Rhizobiales bacterium]|nr:GNAT family N-acetyltransferase [Hyphomicrobiales bacterium]